jgi:glucosyl-3-phosphoglycerate synthase
MKRHTFTPIQMALVPVIYGYKGESALAAAQALSPVVVVVGVVVVPEQESLSAGATPARELRKVLRALGRSEQVRPKSQVIVSHKPWADLLEAIRAEQPDLLLLEWAEQLTALSVTLVEVLTRPPCDVALVRRPMSGGPFPPRLSRVLVPIRGGPHAELAARLGLGLRPSQLTTLHLTPSGVPPSDAPFRGLERVLKRLPEVQFLSATTADPAQTILEYAENYDLVVMGTTAQSIRSQASLGAVADRVLRESDAAVMAVKTRRPMPVKPDETAGTQAISILVDKWFAENTFHAAEFADLKHLLALKEQQGLTISLALPALNEEATVGRVIKTVKRALLDEVPLLDEIVVIDSDSTDRTREIAAKLGVPVYVHQHLLPELGARPGKGEALWKSLFVTRGDIIAWIDTDIVNIYPRFVYGILGPLLFNPRIQFVKGFYRRPLKVGDKVQAGGGGRVTELTARPLLNLFYPELSGIIQPLSGEYAGRRSALEQLPFFSGYGVETGLLIDMFEKYGLDTIAQVDLLERVHHNQPLDALSKMSFAILQAVIRKLERRYGRAMLEDVNKSMKLIRYQAGNYFLDVEEINEPERPPIVDLPAYPARKYNEPNPTWEIT